MSPSAAYATLLTTPAYLPGVLVLHACLVAVGSKYPLVAMVTPSLSSEARDVVARRGIIIRDIDHLYPTEGTHKLAEHDARFADTWTKLRYVTLRWERQTARSLIMISPCRRAFELVEYDASHRTFLSRLFIADNEESPACSDARRRYDRHAQYG